MFKSTVENIQNNQPTSNIKPTVEKKKNSILSSNRVTLCSTLFGISAGLTDGFATTYYAKKDLKNTLNLFKNASFKDKKLMLQNLLDNGKTIKEFKTFAHKVINKSPIKDMFKRGLLYGGIAAVAGIVIDSGLKYTKKLQSKSEEKK